MFQPSVSQLLRSLAITTLIPLAASAASLPPVSLGDLKPNQSLHGFRTLAIYLNDTDRPMGARFVHGRSGFTLDVLEIQSVPQAFVWVTTFPTSNMGEPHTQEHLLLGKGNKGRAVATLEPMALADSSAFTMQWRTCYSFYTSAGVDVFFDQAERRLDALLHPDYTDEEVRREVRNFGVAENARDQTLRLEEKGTVYNEMVSSMDQPIYRIYRAANAMVYGDAHPLAFNSGGSPEALRALTPADIRAFHRRNYHLANMGMIASLPKDVTLATTLSRFDAVLRRIEPVKRRQTVKSERDLPAPRGAGPGSIRLVAYPHRNDQQPGSAWIVWPANRALAQTEHKLLELLLQNVAGDPTTNLYKRLIDSKTKTNDFGIKTVSGHVSEDLGHPVTIAFGDLPASRMNEQDLGALRAIVLDELDRIAAMKAGSPELSAFNERMRSRLVDARRTLSKFVNSPPTFGFRSSGSGWVLHLHQLEKSGGFRRSLTLKRELAMIEKLLARDDNIWTEMLARWKLTGANPYILAAKPDPALIAAGQEAREQRIQSEITALKRRYAIADDQQAIRRYRAEYDANTVAIERATAAATPPKFVDKPPLTLDEQLSYKVISLAGGVPLVASTFDSMTSGTAGIALRLDAVPEDRLHYVALLPTLLTRVGVIENGRPVSYDEMSERLKKEVLSLNAGFSTNPSKERVELVVRGSGNDRGETERALEWMALTVLHPDWRPENLPRIRDVVDQALTAVRRTMQSPEERWVQGPATAYWRQSNPLLMTIESFMTQAHHLLRLAWLLKPGDAPTRAAVASFLSELAAATSTRDALRGELAEILAGKSPRIATLPAAAKALAIEAARDLEATLPDLPDSSLAADWSYLCRTLKRDLSAGPEAALAELHAVRRLVLRTGGARTFVIAAASTQETMRPGLERLIAGLEQAPHAKAQYRQGARVRERLSARDPQAGTPVFVGLVNPNSQSGVFLNSAPLASYAETDASRLTDFLATNLYGGGGAHGIFMKTWAAGLAYSNGIRARPATGRLSYYAERTPELPQTLRFVVDELRKAGPPDAGLVEYAVAEAFAETRAAAPYETRGEAMAADLADGVTPEVVARFRKAILALRTTNDLGAELGRRMNPAYSAVLPGLGTKARDVADAVYMVIGPEKQFVAWEEYLRTVEGADAKLHRLYPRDFWIPATDL